VLLNVLVEGKELSFRRGVVGVEEVEVEVMLFDGYIEDEAYSAHCELNNYIGVRNTLLNSLIKEITIMWSDNQKIKLH